LADASDAYMAFKVWADLEDGYDGLFYGASLNGTNFYGSSVTGDTGGWSDRTLDLTNVYTLGDLTGRSQVWVAFVLDSDYALAYPEGAYVDDVVLNKYVGANAAAARPLPVGTPAPGSQDVTEQPAMMTINR
ncbi:MAG: hypothetical protein JXM73_21330, partial [Anaerolineae bacterium]|nr:hypothetical protein [Anaerolineae bacterium]